MKNKGEKGTSVASVFLKFVYEKYQSSENKGKTGLSISGSKECHEFVCDGRKMNSVWVGPHETKWIGLRYDLSDMLYEFEKGYFNCQVTVEHTHGCITLERYRLQIPKLRTDPKDTRHKVSTRVNL